MSSAAIKADKALAPPPPALASTKTRMRLHLSTHLTRSLAMSASDGGSVGIIGGGVAGLSCASRLEQMGVRATVYDTGKRGVGGRASSRTLAGGRPVDHAAQLFTATSPDFKEQVALWEADGVVSKWPGVGRVHADTGEFTPLDNETKRYIGSTELGMGSITAAIASSLITPPVTDVWVSPSSGLKRGSDGVWDVRVNGKVIGRHESIVIAHNGKWYGDEGRWGGGEEVSGGVGGEEQVALNGNRY